MVKRIIYLSLFFLCLCFSCFSQTIEQKYKLYKGYGLGSSIRESKINSVKNAINEMNIAIEKEQEKNKSLMYQFEVDVEETSSEMEEIADEILTKRYSSRVENLYLYDRVTVKKSNDSFASWIILARPKVEKSSKKRGYQEFGFSPVVKSTLIPGWGQLTKKEKPKALAFFFAEVTSISVAITAQIRENYYKDQKENETDEQRIDYYQDKVTQADFISKTAWNLTVLIHLYNIFDAFWANPKYYSEQKNEFSFYYDDKFRFAYNF